jgi:cyclopropane-fatty-acyl-phospholipid synthase
MHKPRKIIEQSLCKTSVRINGSKPWDIQVRDDRFYASVLQDGSLGLGESYMAGWWDSPRIDEAICRLLKGNIRNLDLAQASHSMSSAVIAVFINS